MDNRAFVLYPGGHFTFEKRIVPELDSDRDVLVRVVATGLCGSDVSECVPLPVLHLHLSSMKYHLT